MRSAVPLICPNDYDWSDVAWQVVYSWHDNGSLFVGGVFLSVSICSLENAGAASCMRASIFPVVGRLIDS